MKQSNTINNEIIRFFSNVTNQNSVDQGKNLQHTPGKHVVNNILNYARAMNVMHGSGGQAFIVLGN